MIGTAQAATCPIRFADKPFEYSWEPPVPGSINNLGLLVFAATGPGPRVKYERAITVGPAAKQASVKQIICPTAGAQAVIVKLSTGPDTSEVTVRMAPTGARALQLESNSLRVKSFRLAPWPAESKAQAIDVPYDSDPVTYLPPAGAFTNVYLDWQRTNSTKLKDVESTYEPLTNGMYQPLKERLVLKASKDFDLALPDIPNPKSPFMASLAGRTVIDIWGSPFTTVAANLDKLRRAGLTDCVAIIHVWQKNGYDSGLPTHYPANLAMGGDEALERAVKAGKRAGCYVALHENYVDEYPNSANFSWNTVALDSAGKPEKAWYNDGAKLQSYGTKPTYFVKNAATQSPEIHRRYGTTASFLDVNSAVGHDWRVDMDQTQPGAGMFVTVAGASTDLWNFERKTHAGPVFGEGLQHWFWSGLLDGVEAQFGAANIRLSGVDHPLFVDFDLLKIHPLIVNHGMGYFDRWKQNSQGDVEPAELLDVYRMQEVIYGHSPYVGSDFWNDIPEVLTEQNLIGPVAKRYATETVTSIKYQVDGAWADTNQAIKNKNWNRPLVTYSNGLRVVANNGPDAMLWEGLQIPRRGWAAKATGLLAYTALINGQIADYAETTDSCFANARNALDLEEAGTLATPVVRRFSQSGPGAATLQLQWKVGGASTPEELRVFVHFVDVTRTDADAISWQSADSLSAPSNHWSPGQTIIDSPFQVSVPPTARDGQYAVRVGLFSAKTGLRAKLAGEGDQTGRYTVGTLTVADGSRSVSFDPIKKAAAPKNTRRNASGTPVNFGPITTDGLVWLQRNGSEWRVHTYPSSRAVLLRLESKRFGAPSGFGCESGTAAEKPNVKGGSWEIHVAGAGVCKWKVN